ncbi:MAG TPA: hypothetical protein PLZ12_09005 [Saprospiraceae bacterium]|nr:hypothetical protein [Saprospiraceae bacterium]
MSNLQLELLKLYATNIPEQQLLDIKQLLAAYFAELIDRDMSALWEEKEWDERTIEIWKNEHLRTSYK